MPPPPRPTTDRATGEIIQLYRLARDRLEGLVRGALERGAHGTAAFYEEQLGHVHRILAQLQDVAVPHAARTVAAAYSLGARAADQAMGRPAVAFAGVHQQAIDVIAANLAAKLNEAAVTVGRRTDDAFRRAALQQTAIGIAAGQPRREVSAALERKLVDDGVTDAMTGFVDSRGRRWGLDTYTEMVARTTTREAVTAGTANRLLEAGRELVTITAHSGACAICIPFEGNTYALTPEAAARRGYPMLEQRPPFHPNCRHVMTPAAADFEAFEQLLAEGQINVPTIGLEQPAPRTAGARPEPPLSDQAEPSRGDDPTAVLRQQTVIDLDPGREPGAEEAYSAWLEAQDAAASKAAKKAARDEKAALDEALGPDLVTALDDWAKSGVPWARDLDLRRALASGDTTLEDVEEMAERELAAVEGRRAERERLANRRGFETKRIPCFVCGRFKNRPSDICQNCGDNPVTYGGDARTFDMAYGYAPDESSELGGTEGVRGRGTLRP